MLASKQSVFAGRAVAARATMARARAGARCVRVNAREAAWCPGSDAPAHLDGSLPGDFGFDPLGLGVDPVRKAFFVQAELQNGRWAMLGAAGVLFPELLSKLGAGGPAAALPWYKAGAELPALVPDADPRTLNVIMFFLFLFVENKRWNDFKNPGSQDADPFNPKNKVTGMGPGYPGLDPAGLAKDGFKERQVKEIKNARLAMMAMLGFFVQSAVTDATPLDNLVAHLSDPWGSTILSNLSDVFVWQWTADSALSNSGAAPFLSGAGPSLPGVLSF